MAPDEEEMGSHTPAAMPSDGANETSVLSSKSNAAPLHGLPHASKDDDFWNDAASGSPVASPANAKQAADGFIRRSATAFT